MSVRKRLHDTKYATVVVARLKPDSVNQRLNETLFQAQRVAKQSTSMIKDIQKDVQSTLKKYDDYVRLSESRGQSEKKIGSPLKLNLEACASEGQLAALKQQEKVLLDLLQNVKQQEQLLKGSRLIDNSWFEQKEKQLNSMSRKEIFLEENVSPIKQVKPLSSRSSTLMMEMQRSTIKKSQTKKESSNSYAKIHSKKKIPDLMVRNSLWKQKVSQKINEQKKQKQIEEMKNCTFKPKILNKNNINNFSVSKEFQKDLNEIVDLIDELTVFKQRIKQ